MDKKEYKDKFIRALLDEFDTNKTTAEKIAEEGWDAWQDGVEKKPEEWIEKLRLRSGTIESRWNWARNYFDASEYNT